MSLYSEPGDPYGGPNNVNGKSFFFGENDGRWRTNMYIINQGGLVDSLSVTFISTDNREFWSIIFGTGPTGAHVFPGYYDNAPRWTGPASYGFGVDGDGGTCAVSSGNFCILDSNIDYHAPNGPVVISFAATFELHCYGQAPALRGTVSYRSSASGGACPRLVQITSLPPPSQIESGVPFSYKPNVVGGVGPYTFTLQGGSLPTGLTLAADGLISGTPTQLGDYSANIHIKDAVEIPDSTGHELEALFKISVVNPSPPAPLIIVGQPSIGFTGQAYNYQFNSTGGRGPYQWTMGLGQLPPGLSLQSNGTLSGTPTTPGKFSFAVAVTDSLSTTASLDCQMNVSVPPRIESLSYKTKKRKLTVEGDSFDLAAKLFIDGAETKAKSHDATSFVVKKLTLSDGTHTVEIVNPDGGRASAQVTP